MNKIDGMADSDDGGWQGFERVIDCDSDWRNVTETSTQTPRGWIIDMVTSGIGGALAGYLLVQFLTLFVYMNAPVLRPKQPHILLIQTWSAMMLSGSLLVYHGHFTRERGFFSICTLWDIWAIFISLGFFLNCQALRVVKVHRKRVEELDTNQMILNVNLRKQSDGAGVPGWRGVVKRKVARNRHKLVFYKDLFLWMLPWLVTAAIATADGATCFDSYKRTCSYKKKESPRPMALAPWPSPCPRLALPQPRTTPLATPHRATHSPPAHPHLLGGPATDPAALPRPPPQIYPFIFMCLSLLPMARTVLLGHELHKLGTKDSFIEFALLRRGMLLIFAALLVWLFLSYLRNYTPLQDEEYYRVGYRQAKTGVFYAVILYWQAQLLGSQVRAASRRHMTGG